MQSVCSHIKKVKKTQVTKIIADASGETCQFQHVCDIPNTCLECGFIACGNIKNQQFCIDKHMKQSDHSLSLELTTGQIRCFHCKIDSFRSFIVGYTGTDQQAIQKCKLFSDYIIKCWSQRQYTPISQEILNTLFGLVNLKNTCYFNSTLQFLFTSSLPEIYRQLDVSANKIKYKPINKWVEYFYDDMLEKYGSEEWHIVENIKKNKTAVRQYRVSKIKDKSLNLEWKKFVKEAPGSKIYNPIRLFECFGAVQNQFKNAAVQNDAQECLRALLDNLSEGELLFLDLNMERYKKVQKCLGPQKLSIVDRLFGMVLASRVICFICQNKSWALDMALDIQVSVSNQVKELAVETQEIEQEAIRYPFRLKHPSTTAKCPSLINSFFSQEKLTKNNFFKCAKCPSSNATKRFFLVEPSEFITIVIKRFKGTNKDTVHVPFQQKIDVSAVTLDPIDPDCPIPQPRHYILTSVIVHEGVSSSHGHYICCSKIQDSWVIFNDSKITPTTWQRVSKMQAYILLYRSI